MNLLQMSFSGMVMILSIIVIRAFTIYKLPKKVFLLLWSIVVLRLLIPFSLSSVFSIYSFIEQNEPAMNTVRNTPIANILPIISEDNRMSTVINTSFEQSRSSISLWVFIWLTGVFICAMFFLISYIKCLMEFRTSLPFHNSFTDTWLKEHKLKRPITIRQSSRISTPLTYGIIHPIILMPKRIEWESIEQLKYILIHEFIHIKHFDGIIKLLLIAALCVHWFNPMVWIMYILFNRDIELACDEAVVRYLGEDTRKTYALTLINMEETKSGFTPLCNNFSKNAIEERITAIMKMKKISLSAILIAVILIAGVTTAFATSADSKQNDFLSIPNTVFTEEEYDKLLALRFDGYEDMTVSEYRKQVWALIDTPEYIELLDRYSKDEQLYQMKDTNETASFLFHILEPLTAEDWGTRKFKGYVRSDFNASDNASLEYTLNFTILDADMLSVREYSNARIGIVNALQAFMQNKTAEELQNEVFMKNAIDTEIMKLIKQWNSNGLQIDIPYIFSSLSGYIENKAFEIESQGEEQQESRQNAYATKEDYKSLFSLKTSDYQEMSVKDFNAAVLEWGNENFERSQRVREDAVRNDYQVSLTEDEISFAAFTTALSEEENFRMIQSDKTGKPEENPMFGNIRLEKDTGEENAFTWCNLDYQFSYHISDRDRLKIKERDYCIGGMVYGIQKFWDETSIDDLLNMSESDVIAYFKKLASEYSNELITIIIDENRIQFEHLDERNFQ